MEDVDHSLDEGLKIRDVLGPCRRCRRKGYVAFEGCIGPAVLWGDVDGVIPLARLLRIGGILPGQDGIGRIPAWVEGVSVQLGEVWWEELGNAE